MSPDRGGAALGNPGSLNRYSYVQGDPANYFDPQGLFALHPESYNGTNLVSTAGPTYTYSFDAMMRPTGLTDQNSNTIVNNVTYNPANQLLTFNSETRTYNNLNQMTRLTVTGNLDISYNFPAGTNNGKITSQTDNLSVETVTYQYDSLNRLLSANSTQPWSETYGFDGFGNLLSKTGTGGAPTLSQAVDAATNHIVGQNYDSKGNQLSGPLGTLAYDAENRIASMSAGGVQYTYDSRNKRIWKSTLTNGNLAQEVYFYGIDGQKIGTYTFTLALYNNVNPEMTDNTGIKLAIFFGSKRIGTFDRLGTAKFNANGQAQSFYPYGEDRGTIQPNDSLKFATYTRDTATGLDYADQRYYANNFGRFMTPDPYMASGGPGDPKSWNRYTYVVNNPISLLDPSGLAQCNPEDPMCVPCADPWSCSLPPEYPIQQVEIDCDIKVFATRFSSGSLVHAYIEETVQVYINGILSVTQYQIFQAAALQKSNPTKFCSITQALTSQCWLNNTSGAAITIFYGSSLTPPNTPGTLLYDSVSSPSVCSNLSLSKTMSSLFRNNTTTYGPLTSNSNSWAYTFLLLSGVPLSDVNAIGPYALAYGLPLIGWYNLLPYWF